MSSRRFLALTSVIVTLWTGGAETSAQVTIGAIAGAVSDDTGRVLTAAAIHVTDAAHGTDRTAMAGADGNYRVGDLPVGTYQVTATASGFRTAMRDVVVAVDSSILVDFRLSIAKLALTVDVVEPVSDAQTSSAGLGTVIDRQRIEALPLNRRDFLQLALLTPGVQGPVDGSELSTRGAVAMHANGAREEFNGFLLDGADNNDAYVNRYVVQPSVDSIEEFRVATNSYSAQYGRNAGAQVNVVTRSGTNRAEGAAYEYFRDRALNARNYFDRESEPFGWNQFGAVWGGPLVHDRTFAFASLDLLREHETLSRLGSVPSLAARAGDLSQLGGVVTDPFTGRPFTGNIIPADRIPALARQALAMFPTPNQSDPAVNYLGSPIHTEVDTQGSVRLDQRLSNADQLMGRVNVGHVNLFEPYTEGTGVTAGYGDFVIDRTWNLTLQHSHLFATGAANALRFGANGFARDLLTENNQTDVGALWAVGWLNVPSTSFGYPAVTVAGYSRVGDAFSLPLLRDSRTYQVADDLSIDRGSHLLKIGGDLRHIALDSHVDLFSRGSLSFTGAFTGSGIGDLLLGLPTFGIQAQIHSSIALRTNVYAAYVQDDWQVAPRVTVNVGLRYEYMTPPIDAADAMSTFDFTTQRLTRVGADGASRSGIQPDTNNFAPRLGVSWRLADDMVVRGGYGIYYELGSLTVNTSQFFNPPQFDLRVFVPSAEGMLTLQNPFPSAAGFAPPPTLSVVSADFQTAYLQHWNAALEWHAAAVGTMTVAYAGSKGTHLVRAIDANQPLPAPGDVQTRRQYPQFGDIFVAESDGRSRFDSLQLSIDRPMSRHVSLLGSYTLSRSMDDASAFLGTPADPNFPQDSHHPDAEWAPSSYDVRHRFSLAYIVTLSDANAVTRGMQLQGIAVVHSGQPFTPLLQSDNSNTGNTGGSTAGMDRPNLVGDPELANPTPNEWFDPHAFVIPAPYTFGTAGRNSLRGQGYASFDVAVQKRIAAALGGALTIGVQVFNVFNRANFDLPGHFADAPSTFGRILSAKAPRELQLMARLRF